MSPLLTNDRSPLCGPLHAHINAYLKLLEERGYKQHTIGPIRFCSPISTIGLHERAIV